MDRFFSSYGPQTKRAKKHCQPYFKTVHICSGTNVKVQFILEIPNIRLVPLSSFALATALIEIKAKDDGTERYSTPQFLLRSTVRLSCNGTGTVRWYAV